MKNPAREICTPGSVGIQATSWVVFLRRVGGLDAPTYSIDSASLRGNAGLIRTVCPASDIEPDDSKNDQTERNYFEQRHRFLEVHVADYRNGSRADTRPDCIGDADGDLLE